MKTINIQGKPYIEVNERIKEFHRLYPNGSITTEILSNDDGTATMKATIIPDVAQPTRVFTGLAYEKEGSSFINKNSYIENCETSAVGRALGMLGIGIDTSVASADEVINAVSNVNTPSDNDNQIVDMIASFDDAGDIAELEAMRTQFRPEVKKMSKQAQQQLLDAYKKRDNKLKEGK